jgi:hypothetical protein
MKKARLLFLVIILNVSSSFAQSWADPNGIIRDQLLNLINSRYGLTFQYIQFTVFDTLIDYSNRNDENIQDPYGTLRGCILFSTYADAGENEPSTFITGIVRNNQIIWDNAPGASANLGGQLLYAKDINNDGEVDLLFSETDRELMHSGGSSSLCYLYILSWNGINGRFINAFNDSGKSAIVGDGGFELFYSDGDNNQEIKAMLPDINMDWGAYNTSKYPYVTYGWNGAQYGLWSSIRQVAGNEFLQANRINISMKCSVQKNNNLYQYNYVVGNDISSKQNISDIYIGGLEDTTGNQAPINWQSGSSSYIGGRAFIKYSRGIYYLIHPGQTMGGFRTISPALPAIVKYYIQGYTAAVFGSTDEEKQNIYNNSVNGYTLGTSDTTIPFTALNIIDTLISYTTQSRSLGWIKDQTTSDKYLGYFNTAKTYLQQNNVNTARTTLQQVSQDVNTDSTDHLTSEAYALIRYNTEYLLTQLPESQPGCIVKLINSTGSILTNGTLQYRDSTWKDAINNNDGTFTINTNRKKLNLRMTYEYGTQTKSNVVVGTDTVTFQTVNAQVQLKNSQGIFIDTGIVQYYAGAWRDFGTTTNGITTKELLPIKYRFKMTYNDANNQIIQNVDSSNVVVFQTINTIVQFKNSQGTLLDTGIVQYNSGGWRDFGTTKNGITSKELLPAKYTFRITYGYANNQKTQNTDSNAVVTFQTVKAVVQLQNSQGVLIDSGVIQYNAGGWKEYGTTVNGVASKELLPNNYTFKMTYAYASKNIQQNIGTNPTVIFQTDNAIVRLLDSHGNPLDTGSVQYNAGGWKIFGATVNGVTSKELLANSYNFRMTYAFINNTKAQNIDSSNTIEFSTVLCNVKVTNSSGQLLSNAIVTYSAGGWKPFGTTVNGITSKELLPATLTFKVQYGKTTQQKTQDINADPNVEFNLP